MSGGSYDYFYSKCPETLAHFGSTLEHMAERCAERAAGPPEKHYKEGTDLDLAALGECAVYLRAIAWRMRGMATLLSKWEEVMHDIEWWASGDSGAEEVIEEFKRVMATLPKEDTK